MEQVAAFRPGWLNWPDGVVLFERVEVHPLRVAVRPHVRELTSRLAAQAVALGVADTALARLVARGFNPA